MCSLLKFMPQGILENVSLSQNAELLRGFDKSGVTQTAIVKTSGISTSKGCQYSHALLSI